VEWWGRLTAASGPPLETLRSGTFIALDLETTGLDPARDAVVSAAAIPFIDGQPEPGYATLVNPGRPIPSASTLIHGIADADVADAPGLDDVLPQLEYVLAGHIVVGHGIGFDLAILSRECRVRQRPRLRNLSLDTRSLVAALHPAWRDVELETVAGRYGVPITGRHTAPGDALIAGRLLLALLPELAAHGVRDIGEIGWLQRRQGSPGGPPGV
jgi:DNA polymerase-3 subunit epsilon/CBS domain-containing protein